MAVYKFTYFRSRGPPETTLLLMRLAGQTFEDNKLDLGAWMGQRAAAEKGSSPQQYVEVDGQRISQLAVRRLLQRADQYQPDSVMQLPHLEVNGTRIQGSNTINRFLAKTFGFTGESPEDAALCDMVVDMIQELAEDAVRIQLETDHDAKVDLQQAFLEDKLHPRFERLESMLEENKDSPFLVGSKLTWADVTASTMASYLLTEAGDPNLFELSAYPQLCALRKLILQLPQVQQCYSDKQLQLT